MPEIDRHIHVISRQRHGANITPEQRLEISTLCASGFTREAIAERVGCSVKTVTKWRNEMAGEEWDRIQEEQRKGLIDRAIPIVFRALGLLGGKLDTATVRELVGVIKVIAESSASWGGLGAAIRDSGFSSDEMESLLAAGEMKRRQAAIEAALASGSLEPLQAFAPAGDKEEV